jgi:hypothetical protein
MAHTSACLSYIPTHAGCQSYCNTAYLAVHGCLPYMYVFACFVCIVACLALDHCLLCNEWSPVCYVWLPALLWTGCLPCYGLVACLAIGHCPAINGRLPTTFWMIVSLAMDVGCLVMPGLSCLASLLWIISSHALYACLPCYR